MRRRILILAAVLVALLSASIAFRGTARASTSGCSALGAACGNNANVYANGWYASSGTLNATVLANPVDTTSTNEDWYRTTISAGEYQYEFAPAGVRSGLCASDPGGGVPSDPSPDGIILRTCNTAGYQYFRTGNAGMGGNQLVNVNTGLVLAPNGTGQQLSGGGTSTSGSYWTWQGGGNGQMSPPPGFTTKILEDQFQGTSLDASKWATYVGETGIRWNDHGFLPSPYSGFNGGAAGSTGAAMYAPSQLAVNNGLNITAQRNTNQYAGTYPWLSGTINSEGLFSLPTDRPWYAQVKMQIPDTSQGAWPSFWFLRGTPGSPDYELDGFEGGFKELPGVPANRTGHWDYHSAQGNLAQETDVGFDMSQGYHVFGVKFVPNTSITWYLDGVQKFQVLASNGITITAEPFELMLNLQVGSPMTSGYHTVPNSGTPPMTDRIAEVQAYTP
jgi:hypothetical protein